MASGWVIATKVDGGTEIYLNLGAARTMARHRRAEQTNIAWAGTTDTVLVKETPEQLIAQMDEPLEMYQEPVNGIKLSAS